MKEALKDEAVRIVATTNERVAALARPVNELYWKLKEMPTEAGGWPTSMAYKVTSRTPVATESPDFSISIGEECILRAKPQGHGITVKYW